MHHKRGKKVAVLHQNPHFTISEEEGLVVDKGSTPWERQSEFVPRAAEENGALEEFLIQVYRIYLTPKIKNGLKITSQGKKGIH